VVIIIVIIFVYYNYGWYSIAQTHDICSDVDGQVYKVHTSHENPQNAANLMALLNMRVIDLMRVLRRKYGGANGSVNGGNATGNTTASQLDFRVSATRKMLKRYNPDNLVENSPKDPKGDTAYSLNKGETIAICLRDKKQYSLHDLDILTFVTYHEMAHIAIDDLDHPPEFWSVFKFLLIESALAGIYTSADFRNEPEMYCGLRVDYNPMYDPSVQ
jgi:hypothetical protein